MTPKEAAPMIKQAVSAIDAAKALGLAVDRYGRCPCPIHGGTDRNLKLYSGERGYYCYVCHSGGDVIDLVQNVTGSSMRDAAQWLNDTFRLGLVTDRPTDRKVLEAAQRAISERKARREQLTQDYDRAVEAQQTALETTMRLEGLRDRTQPKTYGEDFSDTFSNTLMWLEEMRIYNDDLAILTSEAKEALDHDQ